ncbi:MAG: ribbon-helix-helix domain-containing protein [Gloeotrichia echinulata IR180]|jgi:predicted transcriptional regulator
MLEPEMSKTVNTGVKLDAALHERLKALSQVKDRSPHWLMCVAIAEYVEREEAYEREKREDRERWERYQASGNAVSSEAVDQWLASWGMKL